MRNVFVMGQTFLTVPSTLAWQRLTRYLEKALARLTDPGIPGEAVKLFELAMYYEPRQPGFAADLRAAAENTIKAGR
jgi:hypothetical protein